ncbi:MAG: FAD-dependent oxidoreductase [Candidatus Sumerlaeia bacterium]
MHSDTPRRRIVILGGGFGGAYAAQRLSRRLRDRPDVEILLLDRQNYFIFYPLLVEAGTGNIEPRHAVVPLRDFLRGPNARFIMAEVVSADPAARTVSFEVAGIDADRHAIPNHTGENAGPATSGGLRRTISYDHLIVALGSVTRLPPVPGLHEFGFQMKSLSDAVALRDRAIFLLEVANTLEDPNERRALLHFVVVGANFSGVEVAGEFQVFLREAVRLYPNVGPDEPHVTLVEKADRILPALDERLAGFAHDHLVRRGMDIRLHTTIERVEAGRAVLSTGEAPATQTVIWCAGIAANPAVARLGLPVDERGYILCGRDLRVQGFDDVWAIGDCAVNLDRQGRPYPATAQHAVQQARVAADNIAGVLLSGRPPRPCDAVSRGAIAALGCRTAVADVFGVKLSGFPAWWLWRTVYLLKMPTLGRKVRVALDWTLAMLFRKDFVQLGVHQVRASEGKVPPSRSSPQ